MRTGPGPPMKLSEFLQIRTRRRAKFPLSASRNQ
jgi:hypothetical protein